MEILDYHGEELALGWGPQSEAWTHPPLHIPAHIQSGPFQGVSPRNTKANKNIQNPGEAHRLTREIRTQQVGIISRSR